MHSTSLRPELLSPAGDMECLTAAIDAGCDAVYAGADRYGARAYAGNFTTEEFIEAVDRVHLYGRKIYLTLNTLIKQTEYDDVAAFLKPFYAEGLDGVIVQDLGVISLIRSQFPDIRIHASTQMSVSSVYGARLLKDMGVSRIVPSRELSYDEICLIQEEAGVELECFIHGAMCYSYSGLCLMSSFLGGRSGNRGRCAGPCRQPYRAGASSGKERLMKEPEYLLSMKDMCTIDILDELTRAGISSFKIEGRMKSPGYVYGVTEIYRRNLDKISADPDREYRPDEADRRRLVELYSRGGISDGYYHRRNGKDMITVERGSYRREDTGRIQAEHPGIALKAVLKAHAGEAIKLGVVAPYCRDGEPLHIEITGDITEEAGKRPMSEDDFIKQLERTGGTDFCFESIEVDTDGRSFVRVSELNALRRSALDEIKKEILGGYKRCM